MGSSRGAARAAQHARGSAGQLFRRQGHVDVAAPPVLIEPAGMPRGLWVDDTNDLALILRCQIADHPTHATVTDKQNSHNYGRRLPIQPTQAKDENRQKEDHQQLR